MVLRLKATQCDHLRFVARPRPEAWRHALALAKGCSVVVNLAQMPNV